jgi:Na+/H+ antiporter
LHHETELTVVVIAASALAIGALMRLVSARTKFPYTIGMLLVGIGLGVLLEHLGGMHAAATHVADAAHGEGGHAAPSLIEMFARGSAISPHLIIMVFLPALIFESAYAIDVHTFRNNVGAVVVLAVPALVVATLVTAAAMVGITAPFWGWGWPAALVFGALISATDPVAVVAILRELGVSKRLGVLIEGESLLNDGTAIVVFTVLFGMLTDPHAGFSVGASLVQFAKVVVGGIAVGLLLALLLSKWIEKLFNDPLSEITLTLVLAYAAMIIAEGFLHVSGVMAVVVAGLWMGGVGKTQISPEVSHFLHRFWETLGYIANTLIFFLVGLVIATQIEQATLSDVVVVLAAYVAIMLIRFGLVYAFQPVADRLSDGVSMADSAVMSWGGLRGAVSLALALIISQEPLLDLELRRQILFATAGVVLLTILVNGTTIGKLLARLGYDRPPLSEEVATLTARAFALERVREQIGEVSRSRDLRACSWGEVEERLQRRFVRLTSEIEQAQGELTSAPAEERVAGYWRRVLGLERQAYWQAFGQGTLGGAAVQRLTRELDRQLDRIAAGDLTPPLTRMPERAGMPWFGFMKGARAASFERLSLRYDLSRGESLAAEKVLGVLDALADLDEDTASTIRETYQRYLRTAIERLEDMRTNLPEVASAIETRLARRIELNFEREAYERLGERGVLDEATVHAELHDVEHHMQALKHAAMRVPIPETADLVAQTPMFSSLDEQALTLLAELTKEIVVPAGQYLFKAGEKGDSLYIIARGAVHVIVQGDDEPLVVDVLGGGDIIGEMALLTGAPRTASARAATSVTLGQIKRDDFERLMGSQPELGDKVWHEFAKRRFDNFVRDRSEFASLDRDDRLTWFERGEAAPITAGAVHDVQPSHRYVFLAHGRISVGGQIYEAPALVRLDGATQVETDTEARIALLVDPTVALAGDDRPPPSSMAVIGGLD